MKHSLISAVTAVSLLATGSLSAQARLEAILVPIEGRPLRVFIAQAGNDGFRYYLDTQTTVLNDYFIKDARTVFFVEPPAMRVAMQQFRGRDYQAAAGSFAEVAKEYSVVKTLAGNPATRATFFEIECLRLLGDYAKMSEKMGSLNKSALSRENEIRQLELNLLWDAVGSKSWDRLGNLLKQYEKSNMPENQQAQLAYCKGVFHENQGEIKEAINAYSRAMVVDGGASEVETRMAALAILRILDQDPDVQKARELWGTDDEKPNSSGYARLLEAGSLARIYESLIGSGVPLPDAYKVYLNYKAPANPS